MVGKVTRKKNSYWVTVFLCYSDKKSAKPDVEPELILKNGKWRFVNFHYPEVLPPDDMKNVLKFLRKERESEI